MKPYFRKLICDSETPVSLYTKLASCHPYAFLLESAEPHEKVGRYSVIGFDPLKLFVFPSAGGERTARARRPSENLALPVRAKAELISSARTAQAAELIKTANPLEILQNAYEEFQYEPCFDLPRLQAPLVGYFCYEVARHFEKLDLPTGGLDIPDGVFFLPKNLLIFDHLEHTLTAIAYEEITLKKLLKEIKNLKPRKGPSPISLNALNSSSKSALPKNAHFAELIATAKENICAGEVFQIVISQLFTEKTQTSPFDLYRRLRLISPSPYMYYLQYPDFSIIGSSPETLVRTEADDIIIRPIAGTRRRGVTPEEDARLEENLKNDEKEQAEHMMLVDLGRNDIGRVAEPGSVVVTRLMEVEKYSHVMHLVSEVRGKRGREISLFDIFKTAFPAGTLTGAPKIRAMEIVSKLEDKPRGIYGGAVGYFDLSGNMDFAIAIRTMLYQKGTVTLRAGAGIVYDSLASRENLECYNKARGPMAALTL